MAAKLTDKQKRFCDEYLANGGNAKQAAIAAGYSEKTAAEQGHQLLHNTSCSEYIGQRQEKTANKLEVTKERVIKELAKIAFGDIRHVFDEYGNLRPLHEIEEDVTASISSVETTEETQAVAEETFNTIKVRKVKSWDKVKALDMLSKHLGLYEKDNEQRKNEVVVFQIPDNGRS